MTRHAAKVLTDIEALIATTSDLLASALGRQIAINSIKRGYIGTVFVDPDQLTSALVNLGINARDAMPDGGQLTIDADTIAIDQEVSRQAPSPPPRHPRRRGQRLP